MKIAVDAAGSEPGLRVILQGTIAAREKSLLSGDPIQPVLYGPGEEIRRTLSELGKIPGDYDIVDAPDIVTMHDIPRDVLITKTSSSIVKAVQDLSNGKVASFVSMSNTGVIVGACRTLLGKMRWISKPALGIPLPRPNGLSFLLDAGATSDPRPNHLVQFAAMGAAFVEQVYDINNPRVGLINIGVENHKGDELARDTYRYLQKTPLNFVGNIEGNRLFSNDADVFVTNGFVGNILLKFAESIPSMILERVKQESWSSKVVDYFHDLDYHRWGGAALLGINQPVVIGHGRSQAAAVTHALHWAQKIAKKDLTSMIRDKVFKTRRALWLSNPFSRGENTDDEN